MEEPKKEPVAAWRIPGGPYFPVYHVTDASAQPVPEEKRSQRGPVKVRFDEDAKRHDGLCPNSAFFCEYMRDVFRTVVRPNGDTTVSIVARQLNLPALQLLRERLADLIKRCECSPVGRAAILNNGGSCAGSVLAVHVPYLRTHVDYLDTVMGKVQAYIASRPPSAAGV